MYFRTILEAMKKFSILALLKKKKKKTQTSSNPLSPAKNTSQWCQISHRLFPNIGWEMLWAVCGTDANLREQHLLLLIIRRMGQRFHLTGKWQSHLQNDAGRLSECPRGCRLLGRYLPQWCWVLPQKPAPQVRIFPQNAILPRFLQCPSLLLFTIYLLLLAC